MRHPRRRAQQAALGLRGGMAGQQAPGDARQDDAGQGDSEDDMRRAGGDAGRALREHVDDLPQAQSATTSSAVAQCSRMVVRS